MPRKVVEPKGGRVMRLVVYLPEELHKAVMHRCIDEDTSATKLAERLLREYLERPPKKGGR
jgi:hypothetical protein